MKKLFTRRSQQTLRALVLSLAVRDIETSLFAASHFSVTDQLALARADDHSNALGRVRAQASSVLPVESAFSKGLDAVRGSVNVCDHQGWIKLRRTATNCWVMRLHGYPTQGTNAMLIVIRDDASVEPLENSARKGRSPVDPKIPSPQAAFRKAVRAVKGRVDFTEPGGQVTFSRSSTREWDIKLVGYRGLLINGLVLSVNDDLRVTEWSAP